MQYSCLLLEQMTCFLTDLDKLAGCSAKIIITCSMTLLSAVDHYASTAGIKHVYVTGHSLGAAMAQAYMEKHQNNGAVEYEAIVFANPGYGESLGGIGVGLDKPDTRMSNILIAGDIISVPNSLSPVSGDQYIIPTELLDV